MTLELGGEALTSNTIDSPRRLFLQEVEVSGHIIDSLILPKVLDCITALGASFRIKQISIGQARSDPSYALVEVQAESADKLEALLRTIADHGAISVASEDCRLVPAEVAGAFPEGFYSTTNQQSEIRLDGKWVEVENQEMDCGIVVDVASRRARCLPMTDVEIGQSIVVGHLGVRVHPARKEPVQETDLKIEASWTKHRNRREIIGRRHPGPRDRNCGAALDRYRRSAPCHSWPGWRCLPCACSGSAGR